MDRQAVVFGALQCMIWFVRTAQKLLEIKERPAPSLLFMNSLDRTLNVDVKKLALAIWNTHNSSPLKWRQITHQANLLAFVMAKALYRLIGPRIRPLESPKWTPFIAPLAPKTLNPTCLSLVLVGIGRKPKETAFRHTASPPHSRRKTPPSKRSKQDKINNTPHRYDQRRINVESNRVPKRKR